MMNRSAAVIAGIPICLGSSFTIKDGKVYKNTFS